MKALLSLAVFALALPAMAAKNLETNPCAQFARGVVEGVYIKETGAIQGHEFVSEVAAYTKSSDVAVVLVQVNGADEDRYVWSVKYEVEVSLPTCSTLSVGKVK